MPKRIDKLTKEQEAQMGPWADAWIARGLKTGETDWATFEDGARRCYAYAGIPWPGVVVRVPNPLVGALAAPIANYVIGKLRTSSGAVGGAVHVTVGGAVGVTVGGAVYGAVGDAVHDAVRGAVHGAVDAAVHDAVDGAVRDAVRVAVHDAVGVTVGGAVDGAVGDAVDAAVHDAVDGAVRVAVRVAVDGAVRDAVRVAVHDAVHDAVRVEVRVEVGGAVDDAVRGAVGGAVDVAVHDAVSDAVRDAVDGAAGAEVHDAVGGAVWRYLGGQFWASWQAYTGFFFITCGLELGDAADRDRSYANAQMHCARWWAYRDFVMVCGHPSVIKTELVDRARPRGWGSHRLHCADGPAVGWDGWSVYSIHGVRVPEQVVMAPETMTASQITAETNAEVRRIMLDRFGTERYIQECGARVLHNDDWGTLYRADLAGDEPLVMVKLVNSTPESDGHFKDYWCRVDPNLRLLYTDGSFGPAQKLTALNAVASTHGLTGEVYARDLVAQT